MTRPVIGVARVASALSAQAETAPESSLDAVMKKGVLRACMPGNYKPFSFLGADGADTGIDIDALMKGFVDQWPHLAKATGQDQRAGDKWLK